MRYRRLILVLMLVLLLVVVGTSQAHAAAPTTQITPIPAQIEIPRFLTDFWQWLVDVVNWWWDWGEWLVQWLANLIAALIDAWNGDFDRLGQTFGVLGDVAKFIFQFTKPIIEFFTFIINNLMQILELAKIGIGLFLTLVSIVLGWLGQIATIILGIFQGILEASPVQMPGLPRCISAPMESQICALWYMGEFTIFADATPGEFLVPLITLGIDILIIAYTIKAVIRVGRLFESITNVG